MKSSRLNHFVYYFSLFLLIVFFLPLLGSCNQKNRNKQDTKYQEDIILEVDNYFYMSTFNILMGSEGEFVPESFEIFLKRHVFKDGFFYTIFELLYKDKNSFPEVYGLEDYSDIYDCNSDDGQWVDRVLFNLEEERIGAELQKMEELVNTGLYAPDEEKIANETAETVASLTTEEKSEKISLLEVRNSDETLGFMEFGKEIFIPQKDGNNWIFINAFENKVTRTFYDSLFRCYCEERWIIESNGNEELKRTEKTEFYENTYKPSLKIFTLPVSDKNKDIKTEKKQYFNDKGLLVKEEVYNVNLESDIEKRIIQSVVSIKYNSDDKISESNITEYFYTGENKEELSYSFYKKYLYKYNGNDIPPNFDYYEDGKLKIRNLYESPDTYTSETFFDDGFHVKAFYKDGEMIKEVFVTNNNNERIKNYE